MPLAIGLITIGLLMALSGIKGVSIAEFINGGGDGIKPKSDAWDSLPSDLTNPATASDIASGPSQLTGTPPTTTVGATRASSSFRGTPKQFIDQYVVPLAKKHHMVTGTSPAAITAANAAHGPTRSGSTSDHQGPPASAWASDMSNGTNPTPNMDALAADLGALVGIHVQPNQVNNGTFGRFRVQIIYRCGPRCNGRASLDSCGGDHCNHVHFGLRVTS